MTERTVYLAAVIAICALCTLFERALPFLLFRGKEIPRAVRRLGELLPMAIMTSLVFYCLRDLDFSSGASFAPRLVACAVTAALHLWRGSAMLSIAGGTVCCMLLTQLVF